ncbi:MAG: YqhA family protein [Saprospiraceae bacterium]|nr:YqhA family protein [Saprospiraceae bacterium]
MKALEYIFRGIGIIASLCLFVLGVAVLLYTFMEGALVIGKILKFSTTEDTVIYSAMGVVDLVLLSFSIFIAAIGIYELFVNPIERLPQWLQVQDLDALKSMLVKVIILVMGISFMGRVVTWDGDENLLNFGVAIGVVILALAYFLNVKYQGDSKHG